MRDHILLLIVYMVLGAAAGMIAERSRAINESEPLIQPTFLVDGRECWMDTDPVLMYKPNQQTVGIEIRCDYSVMEAHMPAIERTQ